MILSIQAIVICILTIILVLFYFDERKKQASSIPTGKLTRFWDGIDRRRFVRLNADVPVKYSLPKNSYDLKITKAKNISAGGICVTLNEKLASDTKISLEICLPTPNRHIVARGKVAWVEEEVKSNNKEGTRCFNVGIEFKEMSPEDRDALFHFIKETGRLQSG